MHPSPSTGILFPPVKHLLILLFTASLALAVDDPAMNDLSVGIALGGTENLAIVKEATSVTAQRVDSKVLDNATQAAAQPPVVFNLGEPFAVPEKEAAELKAAFTDGNTFLSPSKTCEFRANVRYTFNAPPNRKLEFVLCFGCGEMDIRRDGKLVSFGPFDGGYGRILAITKKVFPNDEFLAKFTEEAFKERALRLKQDQPPKP